MSQAEFPSQEVPEKEVSAHDVSKHEVMQVEIPQEPVKELTEAAHHQPHGDTHLFSPGFQAFLQEIDKIEEIEHKLERVIHFMEATISQTGSPHFKDFWDSKRLCIDLFKGNINPSVRVHLWARYSELCREARRLKEIFDEQSAFAVEQIEMALKAVEDEVQNMQSMIEKTPGIDFFEESFFLRERYEAYNVLQRELNLLNVYATKTTALRKELIKTEMRIRNKNRFFQRLSVVGDFIFPRRKELIHQISDLFRKDIDQFIQTSFSHEVRTQELFDIREEIKALQNIAKLLTLNTEVFSHTRLQLSECWDSIKHLIQERKKVAGEQRALFKQHKDAFHQEIEVLKKEFEAGTMTPKIVEEKIDDISSRMRNTQLGKMEIRQLRDEIHVLREAVYEKIKTGQSQEKNSVKDRDAKVKARFEDIRQKIQDLQGRVDTLVHDEMGKELAGLAKQLMSLPIAEADKLQLEKEIHNIRDQAQEKRARAILALSEDDQAKLSELKSMLEEERKERQELKARLESHRRMKGSSSLDFREALQYNDTIKEEKERLEKIDRTIDGLEEQIAEIEG